MSVVTKLIMMSLIIAYDHLVNYMGFIVNTVTKYLRKNNINYNRKESKIIRSRNSNENFSWSISQHCRAVPLVQTHQKINFLQDSKQKI